MDGFHFGWSVKLRLVAIFVLQRLKVFVKVVWINIRACLRYGSVELLKRSGSRLGHTRVGGKDRHSLLLLLRIV